MLIGFTTGTRGCGYTIPSFSQNAHQTFSKMTTMTSPRASQARGMGTDTRLGLVGDSRLEIWPQWQVLGY